LLLFMIKPIFNILYPLPDRGVSLLQLANLLVEYLKPLFMSFDLMLPLLADLQLLHTRVSSLKPKVIDLVPHDLCSRLKPCYPVLHIEIS